MGDVRDIKDAAWAAYCKAPTCRDMGRSKVDAAVDSVLALSARGEVPEGFVLVPREPTPNMIESSTGGQNFRTANCETLGDERDLLRRQWSAMLAAAPQPAGEDEPGCDDCDGYEGEGGHCLMCGKDLSPPHEPAPSAPAGVEALARLIADDGFACTFQSMGQYRSALLREARRLSAPASVKDCLTTADVEALEAPPCPVWLNDASKAWALGWEACRKEIVCRLSSAQQAGDGKGGNNA